MHIYIYICTHFVDGHEPVNAYVCVHDCPLVAQSPLISSRETPTGSVAQTETAPLLGLQKGSTWAIQRFLAMSSRCSSNWLAVIHYGD